MEEIRIVSSNETVSSHLYIHTLAGRQHVHVRFFPTHHVEDTCTHMRLYIKKKSPCPPPLPLILYRYQVHTVTNERAKYRVNDVAI